MSLVYRYLKNLEATFWQNRRNSITPSIFQHDYLHHIALYQKIITSLNLVRKRSRKTKFDIIDVGCGNKPYASLFAAFTKKYVGVDVDPQVADVVARGEKLPIKKNSFDLVLCFQTLEHCESPQKVIAEMYRVLRPGGCVILSTHGAWMYHPCPHDYFRWTNEGLEKLFEDFAFIKVEAMLPWAPSIIQLINIEFYSIACRYLIWKLPLYGMITILNILGKLLINTGQTHFTVNYVVTTQK